MVFSSVIFLCLFLPIVLGGYYLLPKREAKNLWLIAASLLFYAFSGLWYVLLLLFSVFCNYLAGLFVSGRKGVLYVAVAVNLGVLGVFKYLTFLVRTVNQLPGVAIAVPSIVLPVGISFFTFQGLSYVIDVYRNERLKSTRFRDVLLYIALFPQLVAGPIVRYEDVADEIKSRRHTLEQLANGLRRFIIGLSKKLMIADVCGSVVTLIYSAKSSALDSRTAWLAAVCYLIQIYFDFSGYSDMAIGLGLCFGFHFKENFNYPYISASIQEFWRRWHMTLGRFFTRYVYIPLGGNRRGKMRTLCNVMIVMLLSGLWHGAAWTFVLWGFLHGVGMIWDNLEHPHLPKKWMRQAATFAYVCMTFVFFRAESIAQGIDVLKSIVSLKWNGFVFQMASALDMTECYMITKALSMKLPGLLSWFWLGIFVVLIAICFRVLSGEKVSGVVALQRQKGYGRLYPVLLAVLFTWSMISMTGVSEYLYFSF